MENTQEQKTPETLKPEQMESGKWYVVDDFLIKFEKIEEERIYRYKSFDLECKLNFSNIRDGFLCIKNHSKIRYATKEEVLKYFPDEVFEPIELRPEDLVSGEVYKNVVKYNDGNICYYIYKFISLNGDDAKYSKMINYEGDIFYNDAVCVKAHAIDIVEKNIYHATPEEKALLLGEEEPADWKAMYYELKAKYDQLEQKGEKVYFYFNENKGHITYTESLEVALNRSPQDSEIYEAVCIGKKKSVLVNENS